MSGLFVLSILIQLYGMYFVITTASNFHYRVYFVMRFIIELFKLIILIMLPSGNFILWQRIEINYDGDNGKMSN